MLLARTASARERTAARTLAAEASALEGQAAADEMELQAVRAEMLVVRAAADSAGLPNLPPLSLGSNDLPDEMLALICRFLSLWDLARLSCVSRRFTQPTLTEPSSWASGEGIAMLSPIEQGARLQLTHGGRFAEELPWSASGRWKRLLWRKVVPQYRLVFWLPPSQREWRKRPNVHAEAKVVLSEDGSVATYDISGVKKPNKRRWHRTGEFRRFMCVGSEQMFMGTHFVELTVGRAPTRIVGKPSYTKEEMEVSSVGLLSVARLDAEQNAKHPKQLMHLDWEATLGPDEWHTGNVLGLLLDLEQRTLTLYLNGALRGVLVAPGMKNVAGETVAELVGPLQWGVCLAEGSSVHIEHKSPPTPPPIGQQLARAVARNNIDPKLMALAATKSPWTLPNGECDLPMWYRLEPYADWMKFSPDGRIVSVKWGKTACAVCPIGYLDTLNEYSPDGTLMVHEFDLTDFGYIQLRAAHSGTREMRLEGHSDCVTSAQFSPDSSLMVSASDDETIRVWDLGTGECEKVLNGHSDEINSVRFSPDGKLIVSASGDKTVRVWTVKTGECEKVLSGHSFGVSIAQFSPDGLKIVSASGRSLTVDETNDNTVRLWDVVTGECLETFEGHTKALRSLQFSPDGTQIVSASNDKTVRVWAVETGECTKVLWHDDVVMWAQFSPNGKLVVSSQYRHPGEIVRVWDVETGRCERTVHVKSFRSKGVN